MIFLMTSKNTTVYFLSIIDMKKLINIKNIKLYETEEYIALFHIKYIALSVFQCICILLYSIIMTDEKYKYIAIFLKIKEIEFFYL